MTVTVVDTLIPLPVLASAPWQIDIRGLTLGAGTPYEFDGPIEGFGTPGIRQHDTPRLMDHGDFGDRQFLDPRLIRAKLLLLADSVAHAQALHEDLLTAFHPLDSDPTPIELTIRLGTDREYLLYGKPGRIAIDVEGLRDWNPAGSHTLTAHVEFNALDPRLYGAEETGATGPGSVTGGLGFPHEFPHGFGTAQAGQVAAPNIGNTATRAVAVLTGGVGGLVDPRLTLPGTGEFLALDTTLAQADTLEVDFRDRTVTLNGTASRLGTVRRPDSTWWQLTPGANTVRFDGTGNGTLALSWRPAWLI